MPTTSPRPADQLGYRWGVPITSSLGSITNWNRSPDSEKHFCLAVYYKGPNEPPHEEVPEARSGSALSVAVPAPVEGDVPPPSMWMSSCSPTQNLSGPHRSGFLGTLRYAGMTD